MYKNPYIKIAPPMRGPYTELFLIRHCHPDYLREKKVGDHYMPLSKAGLKQRRYLTKHLLKLEFDKVYSSGLTRAQETAFEYAAKAKKEIILDKRLDEINWSDWYRLKYFNVSEKTRRKKIKNIARLNRQLDIKQTNARHALADIFQHGRGKRIGIFSHGNFIKAILTGILNADVIGFLSLEIFQSSVTKLIIDRDGYVKISYINDVDHLPKLPNQDLFITLKD